MYRVFAICCGALLLGACSVNSFSLDAFKPAPPVDNVRLESEPSGAQVKSSNGQTCTTPCALTLQADAPMTVTFTLNGYLPDTENLEVVQDTGSTPQLHPNPLRVELAMAPSLPPKQIKKKQTVAQKPKPPAKPAATRTSAARPPAVVETPPGQETSSPWPNPPPQPR